MEIVSRVNHDIPVNYVDMGLDAYVGWNQADLKFRNNSTYPVQIKAAVSSGYVTVQIMGTDKRDYFVKLDHSVTNVHEPVYQYEDYSHDNEQGYRDGDVIEEGSAGYMIKTYKVKYDRKTARELSRDFLTNSQYPAVDRIVARVEAPPETEPPTEPPTLPPVTVPPVTEPPVTVPPVTEPPVTEPPVTVPPVTTPPTEVPAQPAETTPPTEAPIAGPQPEAVSDVVTE